MSKMAGNDQMKGGPGVIGPVREYQRQRRERMTAYLPDEADRISPG
jgi:hypothetical protein